MAASSPGALPPPRRGWFRRNWFWVVPLVLVLAAVGVGGIVLAPNFALKSCPAFPMIVEELQKNPKVVDVVGEPAKVGNFLGLPAGDQDKQRGTATFTFPWVGPKGKVEVSSQTRAVQGKWGVSSLEFVKADGTKISLTADVQAHSGDDTPKYDPNAKPGDAKSNAPANPGDLKVDVQVPDMPK